MHRLPFHRLKQFAPFVLALLGASIIAWSLWTLVHIPYEGIDWSAQTGLVSQVDPYGPAAALVQAGDQVLTVDAVPNGANVLYGSKHAGDVVEFVLVQAGRPRPVAIRLAQPTPQLVLQRSVPTVVGCAFWLASVVVIALRPSGRQSWLFLLFCQAFATALAAGAVGLYGAVWTIQVFHVLIWWLGPLVIQLHLVFPQPVAARWVRRLLAGGYTTALVVSVVLLNTNPLTLNRAVPQLAALRLLWLAGGVLAAVGLLTRAYRCTANPTIRRQVGLVTLGGGVPLVVFLVVLLLPYALLRQAIIPNELGFLLMPAVPFTYGYAILNQRRSMLDRYISRAAAYTLVLTVLAGLYIVLNTLLVRWVSSVWQQPTAELGVALALAVTFQPLYHRLERSVNGLLYGGSYDYHAAVQLISQTLGRPIRDGALAQTLCAGIQTAMQLHSVRLLLPDSAGALITAGLACSKCSEAEREIGLAATSPLTTFFQTHPEPIDRLYLQTVLGSGPLAPNEQVLLHSEHARLWMPLVTTHGLSGVWVVGPKRGSETFSRSDLELLQVLTRFANTAIQNTVLIAELRQRATEREQLHQQVLRAREAERKRLARELHDDIIQALVGLNYHLGNLCSPSDAEEQVGALQRDLRQTLDDVRRMCADLRPPALDHLGLVSAVRSHVRAVERSGTCVVMLTVNGDTQQPVPEDHALCVYRLLQEALMNVQKHAQATRIDVHLHITPDELCIQVQDNGHGFHVPLQLGRLITDHHFGLVGLRERVDLVHGTLSVRSVIDQGTYVEAHIPLQPVERAASLPAGAQL